MTGQASPNLALADRLRVGLSGGIRLAILQRALRFDGAVVEVRAAGNVVEIFSRAQPIATQPNSEAIPG